MLNIEAKTLYRELNTVKFRPVRKKQGFESVFGLDRVVTDLSTTAMPDLDFRGKSAS